MTAYTDIITVGPSVPPDGGTAADPWSTHDGIVFPITHATANAAFTAAVAALPSAGGDLYVWPGTADYQIDATVTINKPVHVHCMRGSTFKFGATNPSFMFRITSGGCGFDRLRVVDTAVSGTGKRVISIDETIGLPGGTTDGFFCTRSWFEIDCVTITSKNSAVIWIEGDEESDTKTTTIRRGAYIAGNTFLFGDSGQSTVMFDASTPPEPYGFIAIRATNTFHTHVVNNRFDATQAVLQALSSPATSGGATVHGVALFDNCQHTLFGYNTVYNLRSEAVTPTGSDDAGGDIVRMTARAGTPSAPEAHHSIIIGNYFEGIRARRVVSIEGGQYNAVVLNNFGRINRVDAALYVGAKPDAADEGSTGTLMLGNTFHNVRGASPHWAGYNQHLDNATNTLNALSMFLLGDPNYDDFIKLNGGLAQNLVRLPYDLYGPDF